MALPGDQVQVICEDATYVGRLMPRPEMLSDDVVVLKLHHGYNIGISKDRIKEIVVKKKYVESKKVTKKLPVNPKLPTVALVSCGGTIASRIDYRSGGVYADYDAHDFVNMCPELAKKANIVAIHAKQIMSEDLTPNDWDTIAKSVQKALNAGADGVVLTHGTDTLHYTAAYLSFALKNLTKPVIITGSQRSIDRPSSDAFMNLICSVIAAGSKKFSGVHTCFHGTSDDQYCLLVSGSKVRKMHSSRRDAFRSINAPAVAKVFTSGKLQFLSEYTGWDDVKVKLESSFEDKTALVYIHPGIKPDVIEHYISKKYKGLVLVGTAFGHVPTGVDSLVPVIKKAIESGMLICMSTQTLYGRVNPYVYTNLRKLSLDSGVVFLEDIHPETAYIKLGYVLSRAKDVMEARELMRTNLAGEMTPRSVPFEQFLS